MDEIIQNFRSDSVIQVAESVKVTVKTSHMYVASVILSLYFKPVCPVVQYADFITVQFKNISYINSSSLMFCLQR